MAERRGQTDATRAARRPNMLLSIFGITAALCLVLVGFMAWSAWNARNAQIVETRDKARNFATAAFNGDTTGTPSSGNIVTQNLIDNAPTGWGIVVQDNFYAQISGNKLTRVRNGVQVDTSNIQRVFSSASWSAHSSAAASTSWRPGG